MKRNVIALCLGCLFLALASGRAFADLHDEDTMSCGDQLVNIGDEKYQVQTKCGKPADVEYRADVWVYNFGPDRFVYYVTFVDDQVVRIQSDGYGH